MRLRPLLLVAPLLGIAAAAQAEDIDLFNGRDLTGWEHNPVSLGPPGAAPAAPMFAVQDGAILCRGGPRNNGWLHTTRSFQNYELHLEYRWGEIDPAVKAAGGNIYNSGIFLRSNPGTNGPGNAPMAGMMAYQVQLIHSPARDPSDPGGTGDAWVSGYENPSFRGERRGPVMGGGPPPGVRPAAATAPPPAAAPPPPGDARPNAMPRTPPPGVSGSRMFRRARFAEKPIGEWNTFDITVNADRLTYRLNGEVVNEVTGAMAMSGKIGLECENTPILFRNIRLKTID